MDQASSDHVCSDENPNSSYANRYLTIKYGSSQCEKDDQVNVARHSDPIVSTKIHLAEEKDNVHGGMEQLVYKR